MRKGPAPRPPIQRLVPRLTFVDRWFDNGTVRTRCLECTGGERNGYGSLTTPGQGSVYAHRVAYEAWVGLIPVGLQIDHLCRNLRCCNPLHLEPVTARENLARSAINPTSINRAKTHCPSGHEYTPENTRMERLRSGTLCRRCRACDRIRKAAKLRARLHGELER
jgi:hypothetical protein